MKTFPVLTVLTSALALAGNANAQETSFSVSVGATHTDNVRRVDVGEESEVMPEAALTFDIVREGRLATSLSADLTYRGYQENSFNDSDELVGGLDAQLSYAFVPDRFSWTFENNYGQILIDPQAVETPDNRQDLNFLSTGPDFNFPLGGRSSLVIGGRWSDLSYEESDFGNERLSGSIGLHRQMGGTGTLGLDVTAQRVEFDGSPSDAYDQQSAYLVYGFGGPRTQIEVRGGWSEAHDSGDTFSHPLLSVSLTRQMSERSKLQLDAGTGLVDSADAFRRDRGIAGVPDGSENVIAGPDLVEEDHLSASWVVTGGRTTIDIRTNWRNEDREFDTEFDRESLDYGLNLARQVGPRLKASLFGFRRDTDYDNDNVHYEEWSAGIGLDWSLSRNYSVALRAEHFNGGGDTSAGTGTRNYDENRYTLRFTYSSGR